MNLILLKFTYFDKNFVNFIRRQMRIKINLTNQEISRQVLKKYCVHQFLGNSMQNSFLKITLRGGK